MVRMANKQFTKGDVLQIGIFTLLLGLLPLILSKLISPNDFSVGILSSSVLIGVVIIWISSYVKRALSGEMTFMEQRKRYIEKYEKNLTKQLEDKFDSLSPQEQLSLLKKLENDE